MKSRGAGTERSIAGLPVRTAAALSVLFVAAFAAYSLLWPQAPVQEGDSPQYLEVARDLSDFSLDRLHDRTPGYPLLLVLTGSSHEPTRGLFRFSLVFHVASIWMLAVLLHSVGAGRSALLAFCCVLLLPPYVEPAAHVMTENFAQFTLVAGLVCLVLWFSRRRVWLLAVSAVAFGVSALTRPAYQALAPAISGGLMMLPAVFRRAELSYADASRASAALLTGALLLVGSVAYVHHVKFNYFGLTPSLGFHLSTKTTAFVERLPDEYATVRDILIRERDAQLTKWGGTHTGTQAIWGARSDLAAATGLSKPELSSYLLRMNLLLIRRAPVEYFQEVARSVAVYWFPPAGMLANMGSTTLRWLWAIVHLALVSFFGLQLIVFAGTAIFAASRRIAVRGPDTSGLDLRVNPTALRAYVVAGIIVFYTMVLSCVIDIGEIRQRRATEVLFIFMCFLGAQMWRRAIHETPIR